MTTNDRAASVAAEVTRVFNDVVSRDAARQDAAGAALVAGEAATGARERALIALSAASVAGQWVPPDTEAGIAEALSRRNAKDSSLCTFASEIKRACHPRVRTRVPQLHGLCGEVWAAEAEAGKGAQPCRKAFKRRYHMMQRLLGEAMEGRVLATAAAVIAWARTNDPDLDYAKVVKRLRAIHAQLADFAADFPVAGLGDCGVFLAQITKADLKAGRDAKLAGADPTPVVANSAGEETAGAVDLDAMLSEELAAA